MTILHETGFLHIKGIKIFGYKIVIEKESEKISKFSKNNSIEALLIFIWRRKELSNLDNLKGFSMPLGGNCRWVPLSTIA